MKPHIARYFLLLISLLSFSSAFGQIIHVPGDYPAIQDAIDAAAPGDTVLVDTGIYYENLSISHKNITLASNFLLTQDTLAISSTIIDADYSWRVIDIIYGDSSGLICGFTIRHGHNNDGGGIRCYYASPTLRNLVIEDNDAYDEHSSVHGGGIYCYQSNPIMQPGKEEALTVKLLQFPLII